ncbi:MAG: S-adenosylmethionine:tRNA ribosyltransferase-isomerase [Bacteroidales bacterium]|nr:S-adenosylmethionine:tRNA ribosyltransferase-isomerase [Bacteroidales bacterium]
MHNPKNITIEDFDYLLPDERVAKYRMPRDESKLLRYRQGIITEHVFKDVPALLPEDSLLIFNETKVVQARLYFKKATGAKIEVFILEPFKDDIQTAFQSTGPSLWKCFVGNAKKWKSGSLVMNVDDNITVYAEKVKPEGNAYVVRLSWNGNITFSELLMRAGEIPLPPYLKREAEPLDRKRYQTIFAKNDGSVAAPTAGLHFTPEILEAINSKGIPSEKVTLHVSAGTFKPVIEEKIGNHAMHDEKIVVSLKTLQHLHANADKRFTPVGTTSVRTLESIYWSGVK